VGEPDTPDAGVRGVPIRFGVYVPQVAFGFDELLSRAEHCERVGIDRFWIFDHLYAPGMPDAPAFEGWTLATALLARTTSLRVGHLVLCNNFRHPALLARMATTLDVISAGRLELGLGSGSYQPEHREAGLSWGSFVERSQRLAESLEILSRMFAGGRTTFEGRHYTVNGLPNLPSPVQSPHPPIHIGGVGARTIALAARYADVWNIPTYGLDRLEEVSGIFAAECERVGRDPATVRRSVQGVLVLARRQQLDAALDLARRRFGAEGFGLEAGGLIGSPEEVIDRIGGLVEQGFTDFELFLHDRGEVETIELLADDVIRHFRR
jgi:alkanesulfonate monooxygenase SsuD/methylene tetrahydromethanopterin reductase-like flavin-dependent oxidoreductase (luciferase family)